MRFFRSTPAVYESVRATLDSAFGLPSIETATETAIPPVSELFADAQGRVYLCVSAEYCDCILPAELLAELLGSGAVEELTESEYWSVVFPTPVEG